ncbi:transcriptional regulator [Halomarina pelagica]|uniref:transcriptional regulator n=1 Tax=Halomarina pelagica TaxID=2961599 RepID=UPI0020C30FF3|nr:transcriptional regulator [Halomarina sp. BND7]
MHLSILLTLRVKLMLLNAVHLPKLADYGFIEWDRNTHEVMKGPKFDEIRPLLELLEAHEDKLPADWL